MTDTVLVNDQFRALAMSTAKLVGSNITTLRKNTQTLLRSLVIAIAVEEFDQKSILDDAKAAMNYGKCENSEQALIRKQQSNVRTVVENWRHFTPEQRQALIDNNITNKESKAFPDSELTITTQVNQLANQCKLRDKEIEAKRLEAEAEAEADSAPIVDSITQEIANDDSELVLYVAEMLKRESFTDNESAALAILFSEMDAFRAEAVKVSEAA